MVFEATVDRPAPPTVYSSKNQGRAAYIVGQEVSGSLFGAYISKKVHYIQGVSTKGISVLCMMMLQ